MSNAISVIGAKLVENLNFPLTAFDVGWAAGSAIAWSTEVVPFVFIAIIITNIIMIALAGQKQWTLISGITGMYYLQHQLLS